jgi:broad specificity phosphatase PhoE
MIRGTFTTPGLAALLLVCAAVCQANAQQQNSGEFTTVILVRHAEKTQTADDPGLTELGAERALALAHVLGEVEINAVYATQFTRTRATARPLADLLGLDVSVIDAGSSYASGMAGIIRDQHLGEAVVIVSHSNTVPAIIAELGVAPVPVINDDEYDDLYVVTISPGGEVTLLPLRYGAETP